MKYRSVLLVLAALAVTAFAAQSVDQMLTRIFGTDKPPTAPTFSLASFAVVSKENTVKINGYNESSLAITAPATISEGDVTLSPPANGGNANARHSFTGIVNSSLVTFGTMTDGTASTKTKALMDDTPAGEWSAIGGGTADPTPVNDSGIKRKGTNSLKIPFTAAAVAGDGVKFTAFSGENWEAQESVGMWVYSTIALSAGDVRLKTVDSTGDVSFNMPAVPANKWTWVEFDISSLAGGTGDAVTNVKLDLSTAGAAKGAFNLYIDGAYKWDATEELAIGYDLVDSPGSVRSVLALTKANTGTHNFTALAEDTDFFVHYESGNDFLVTITNQSAAAAIALVNHKE